MSSDREIEVQLRAQLPAELHAYVPTLAEVLAGLRDRSLDRREAEARLAAGVFEPLRQQLAAGGQQLQISSAGDEITVGNISQVEGLAIGRGATAQVVRGDDNIVAAAGGVVLVIKLETPTSTSTMPPFMAPAVPTSFVARPAEFDRAIAALLDPQNDASAATIVALCGAGGYGKTTLAAALCHDERLRTEFADGILWVTLGTQNEIGTLVGKIEDMIMRLTGGSRPGFSTVDAAAMRLAELLGNKRLLLVVDDVWDVAHLKPFLQDAPRCTRLITTRNRDTIPPAARRIEIDAMRRAEALALISAGLAPDTRQAEQLQALAGHVGEWPLLLTLVNGALCEQCKDGASVDDAITYVEAGLAEEGVTVFDTSNAEGRDRAVSKTLEISLALLSETERARFGELAIFPPDADIPQVTLDRYWKQTGGLSSFAARQLCTKLARLSLLHSYDATAHTIRLHNVVRAYLRQSLADRLVSLHTVLVDGHRPSSGNWADLLPEEHYFWNFLAYHLDAAGRGDELVATARDLRYLATKTFVRKALPVEADLLAAEQHAPDDPALRLLRRSFVQCEHLLNACADLEALKATLYSRLCHLEQLAPLTTPFETTLARPYLAPRHPLPDLPEPALVRTLTMPTTEVNTCALSADGHVLASGSADGIVKVWDTTTGNLRVSLSGHLAKIRSCALSGDGHLLASASEDATVKIWDTRTVGSPTSLIGHRGIVTSCALSADGKVLASGSFDKTVRVWDTTTARLRATFKDHRSPVMGCALSADGQALASGAADGTVKVWDLRSGRLLLTFTAHTEILTSCALSADGKVLASSSIDGTVKVWDRDTGTQRATLTEHSGWVRGCALSGDGQLLASTSDDGTVKIWDVSTGILYASFTGHTAAAFGCALSADGRMLASAAWDGTVKLWDAHTTSREVVHSELTDSIWKCALSGDGRVVAAVTNDGSVRVWNAITGDIQAPFTGSTAQVTSCTLSADGRVAAAAANDGTVTVWDITTGIMRTTIHDHAAGTNGCALSADGNVLISIADDGTANVWNTTTGTLRVALTGNPVAVVGCALSANGHVAVTAANDGTVRLWDATIGTPQVIVRLPIGTATTCAISADGQIVAAIWNDATIHVWDAATGEPRATLIGHRDRVWDIALSEDGHMLVSVSDDRTLKVWDVAGSRCLASLHAENQLYSCSCSTDGQWIVAGGEGGMYLLQLVR